MLAAVVYEIVENADDGSAALTIRMSAKNVGKQSTPVNMVNHTFWNLEAANAATSPLSSHTIAVAAAAIVDVDASLVPTGALTSLDDARAFDLRRPRRLGEIVAATAPGGVDHCYVLDEAAASARVPAVTMSTSARKLEIFTNQPGLQVYSGNFLPVIHHGDDVYSTRHGGVCLETQAFPNAINVEAWKQQVLIKPGDEYVHNMRICLTKL